MKLITLNTWQGRISRSFAPFFKSQNADIICLQELNSSKQPIITWDLFQTLQTIQDASNLEHSFYSSIYTYQVMGGEVEFGNGILSKYPLSNEQTIFTNGTYVKITKPGDYIGNNRNAQIVKAQTPKGSLTLANHHGHWEQNSMGTKLSMARLNKLADALKPIKGPLIVAGDFNLKSESESIQSFKNSLKLIDLTNEFNIHTTLNKLAVPFAVACDHIFVSEHIRIDSFKVDETLLSDHKALILDFDIK